jgi:hypothetical protein
MKKYYAIVACVLAFQTVFAQLDTANITITNFRLHDGTFSWRGTGTYFDRTSFESAPYTEGHLKTYNGTFRQNFRLLIPQGYDPDYKPGYALMLVFHGYVERANCFEDRCYHGTRTYNPNNEPIPDEKSDINNLLNNDHHLIHGAVPHLNAWNLTGTKKIDDPNLGLKEFPGFVLYPQMLNGWATGDIRDAIRTARLLIKKYNIDPDRVYIHGLSNGGGGLLNALVEAPWLFSAAAPMSAITPHNNYRSNVDKVAGIPMWFFQGGKDEFPTPSQTETTIRILREAGGSARYYLYENLGHGTWNTAYKEPDFFSWFLGNTKANIHIAFGSPTICGTNGEPAKLSVVAGFMAYQWERNGAIIPDATSNVYLASQPGVYRARYSRISATPTEDQWNRWSDPVTVTEVTPEAPKLDQIASIVLRDLNGGNTARLVGPPGFAKYFWYKDGALTTIATTNSAPTIGSGTDAVNQGVYTLVTAGLDNCPSEHSNPKSVFFSDLAPINIPRPTGFTGTLTSPTSVLLRWNDVSGHERNYEIWRRKSTDATNNGWTFVALTNEDVIQYQDTNLDPGTEYWYKIRAVSHTGRSEYAPGNSRTTRSENVIVSTLVDDLPPSAPQNLTAELTDTDIAIKTASIRLTWTASTDNEGVKEYDIRYGEVTIATQSAETSYVISGLPINTIYNFTVVARDRSGNESSPSSQVNANTYIDGFFWEHSTGAFTDMRDIPASYWTSPEFKGRSANLTLEPRTQEDFLVFRFYGYIYISTTGEHQFRIRSNDGVQLYIDGVLMARRNGTVDDGVCATSNITGNVPMYLEAGVHTIEVRYFQYTGDKCLSWQWRGPDAGSLTSYRDMPDVRIRSYPAPPVSEIPPAPSEIVAVANGMTQIDLSWSFTGTPPAEFEIYRATSADGPFAIITRVNTTAFSDQNLLPGTTYFYQLRTVTGESVSALSETVSATTESDTEPPSQPLSLTLYSSTLTSASISWTKSTDNTLVSGYEIWVNGVLYATSPSNNYLIENLEPLQSYTVYVVAVDPNGNKSEPSNTIEFDTNQPEIFYSKASGNLNELSTWSKTMDGSGPSPMNFSTNGSYFVVANRTNTSMGGSWKVEGTVSKVIVPTGVTLTAENSLQGRVEVENDGTLVLANATIPTLVNLGTASTVQYAQSAQQIQRSNYGHLILSGTSNKTFATGVTTVFGSLQVANGIAIKGAANNQSSIVLFGDLVYSGSPGFTSADVSVTLDLRKPGVQQLAFQGGINFYQLKAGDGTQIQFLNDGNPGSVTLGSDLGGGLVLAPGASMNLADNTLTVIGKGAINSAGETGIIHVNEGTIDITSSSTLNSNLWVDETNNLFHHLGTGFSGSGALIVHTPIRITDGLKVKGGTLNSNNNITLLSTPDKTANLQEIENNGRVTGNLNVQRYISPKARTYRYMSTPVEGTKVADWQEYFAITGTFEGASTGSGLGSLPSLFYYGPEGWIGYPSASLPSPYNTNQAPIEKGVGYAAFIRNTTPILMNSVGVPHQGRVDFTVFSPQQSSDGEGWNLLGNPYASTIAWSNNTQAWTKNQIGNVVAVRNNFNTTTGQFEYYDAGTGLGTSEGGLLEGGRIAPGQAFWIQTTGPSPAISIHERAKSTGQQTFYRMSENSPSHVKITLSQNTRRDNALIVFTDYGTNNFDHGYDGSKMKNEGMFNFSSLTADAASVAINNMMDGFCTTSVRLRVENTPAGTYTIAVENPETLSGIGSLSLIDHLTSTSTDLLTTTPYSFAVTSDPNSYGSQRFEIVFGRPSIDVSVTGIAEADCGEDALIRLTNTQRGAVYTVHNATQKITDDYLSSGGELLITVPAAKLTSGQNELNIHASFKGCTSTMLTTPVQFEYETSPVLTGNDVSVCAGSSADLSVTSTVMVEQYEWYGENGRIKGASGPTLRVDNVTEEKYYTVRAIGAGGCTGPDFQLRITPELLEEPEILSRGDSLVTSVHAAVYEWSRNGEVIRSSPADYYFIPELPGAYTLTVKEGGCSKTSRAFVVTDVEESAGTGNITLYPNPTATANINFRAEESAQGDYYLRILDIQGRESHAGVYPAQAVREGVKVTPRGQLRAGVYFLIVEHGSSVRKIKFVIHE